MTVKLGSKDVNIKKNLVSLEQLKVLAELFPSMTVEQLVYWMEKQNIEGNWGI